MTNSVKFDNRHTISQSRCPKYNSPLRLILFLGWFCPRVHNEIYHSITRSPITTTYDGWVSQDWDTICPNAVASTSPLSMMKTSACWAITGLSAVPSFTVASWVSSPTVTARTSEGTHILPRLVTGMLASGSGHGKRYLGSWWFRTFAITSITCGPNGDWLTIHWNVSRASAHSKGTIWPTREARSVHCNVLLCAVEHLSPGVSNSPELPKTKSSRLVPLTISIWCLPLSRDTLSLLNCLSGTEPSFPLTGIVKVAGLQRPSLTN